MKNIIKNVQKISMTVALALLFVVFPGYVNPAHAAFNNAPNDCPTVSVANDTTQQNASATCWGPTVSANPGDIVNVRIYYHNTDTNPAVAVVHLNDPTGPKLSTFNFTGFVNSGSIGSGTVNISSAQTLSLSQVLWYPNKSLSASALPNGQTASQLFTSGINLGSIPGWNTCPSSDGYCHSGSVVASFIVSTPIVSSCSINSFSINGSQSYASVAYGASATLAWNTSNCANVTVNGVTYYGTQATSNSVQTGALTSTQNFTLSAPGVATRTVTANVGTAPTVCSIVSFTTNSTTVPYNTIAQLSWNTSNCTSVTVLGHTYTGAQALSGSTATAQLVLPVNTITLIANDAAGNTDNRTITIYVGTAPTTCSVSLFTANGVEGSLQVPNNTQVTLAWTTSNCTSVYVAGATFTGAQALSGSVSVGTLSGSYSYTLTANGSNGSSDTRNVAVTTYGSSNNDCQITYFAASPSNVISGNSTTLSWSTSNCISRVTVSGTNLSNTQVYTNSITTGPIYAYSSYVITAYNQNGSPVTATTYVSVSGNNITTSGCYISYFTANGGTSVVVPEGNAPTIAWNTTGCSSVTVSGPGVYSQSQYGSMPGLGVHGSAIYTLTAYDLIYNNPQTQTVYVSSNQQNYYPPIPLPNPTPFPYPTPNPSPITPVVITPITTLATNVSTTSARLNGLVPQASSVGNVNAYFEYGTSYSLGSQTNPQTVSTYTLQNYFNTISTVPGTTYYYRADINNGGVITTGDIVSFTTPVTQVVPVYVDHTHHITYGTGTGSALAALSISDQYQTVAPGDTILYTINYKNVSNETLSNVVLNVILPNGVMYRYSTQGMPTTNNTVVATLGSLEKDAQGSVSIEAVTNMDVLSGSNLVSTATLSFAVPSGAQDSAVAYYMNTVSVPPVVSNGGFYFGDGFFPSTFLGWVILIGLIIVIILLIRHYMILGSKTKNDNHVHNTNVHNDIHH